MGEGFDVRMNLGIKSIKTSCPDLAINVCLICFDEGEDSPTNIYRPTVTENYKNLLNYVGSDNIERKEIALWKTQGMRKTRVGDRRVAKLFKEVNDFENYSDIVVDISALPRGIYFSLIGKIMSLLDSSEEAKQNLFILTVENADLDTAIDEIDLHADLSHPYGFGGGLEKEADDQGKKIWFPLMGEKRARHVVQANQAINPIEICPILPFPSKNPRRSDDIFSDSWNAFTNVLRVEPQNLLYAPEQNPFEVYKKLARAIMRYNDALSILGGCKSVVSTFSSKLLSIGCLLVAYEFMKKDVGILNIDAQGYRISDKIDLNEVRDGSELFVTWIIGKPYQK